MAHLYKPAVSKRQVLRPLLRGLVDRVFGGSTAAAVQQLLDETDVSADEVAQIRAMLRERQKGERAERRGGGGGTGSNSGGDE
jgi:predicted transcriptional regulator